MIFPLIYTVVFPMYVSLASTCHPYYACVSLLTIAQCSNTNSEAKFYFSYSKSFFKFCIVCLHEYLMKTDVDENTHLKDNAETHRLL